MTGMKGKENRLKELSSFAVYYGTDRVETLQKYDMVIIEPSGQRPEAVSLLQQKGVLVLAYVSVMEIGREDSRVGSLHEQDFLRINQDMVINREYHTLLLDLRSKNWRTILMKHIDDLLINKLYHGVFLDTIADVEMDIIPMEQREIQINEAIKLVRAIRDSFEDAIIIQNNGIGGLSSFTWYFIDGICWENPPFRKAKNKKWLDAVSEMFIALRNQNVKLFLLFENEQHACAPKLKAMAEKNGVLIYSAPSGYGDI